MKPGRATGPALKIKGILAPAGVSYSILKDLGRRGG
jgi:hypothetical protein